MNRSRGVGVEWGGRRGAPLLCALVLGLCVLGLVPAAEPAGAATTTTRYEAEDWPGTVGTTAASGSPCSGATQSQRSGTITTAPHTVITVTLPAAVTRVDFTVRYRNTTTTPTEAALKWDSQADQLVSINANAGPGCTGMVDFLHLTTTDIAAGDHTLSFRTRGGNAVLDYIDVTVHTPDPTTTTTAAPTTTTTEAPTTTTTVPATTTTTVPGVGHAVTEAEWEGIQVLQVLSLFGIGALAGRALWGGP